MQTNDNDAFSFMLALAGMKDKGYTDKEIADMLGTGEESIKTMLDGIQACVEANQQGELYKSMLKKMIGMDFPNLDLSMIDTSEAACRRHLDPTMPVCDVCSKSEGNGGAAVLEDDGTFSIVCQSCWDNFTKVSPENRNLENSLFILSHVAGIATDPEKIYEWFESTKPFSQNVRDFLVRQGDRTKMYYAPATGERMSEPTDMYDVSERCLGCLGEFPGGTLRVCRGCNMAKYCSKKCQKKDKNRHKKGCREFKKSIKTQNKYKIDE